MQIQLYPSELNYACAKMAENEHSFLSAFCEACLRADGENYELLRPVLHVLMDKYPARLRAWPHKEESR
jgi:hypothetical protein